jgi:hypothetical protein
MPTEPQICVSMREFLRTGKFGPVRLGASAESVRSFFGNPHDVGAGTPWRRTPGFWKYGDVEFHFTDDDQRVWLIFCDTFERLHLGDAASLDRWFFQGHPSCEEVERGLTAAQIPFHRQDMPHEPTGYLLHLDSGVELLFSTGSDTNLWPGCPGLFGFQYAKRDAA